MPLRPSLARRRPRSRLRRQCCGRLAHRARTTVPRLRATHRHLHPPRSTTRPLRQRSSTRQPLHLILRLVPITARRRRISTRPHRRTRRPRHPGLLLPRRRTLPRVRHSSDLLVRLRLRPVQDTHQPPLPSRLEPLDGQLVEVRTPSSMSPTPYLPQFLSCLSNLVRSSPTSPTND